MAVNIEVNLNKIDTRDIAQIERQLKQLGDDISDDYWEPTEGNAKHALRGLLAFAKAAPHGIWEGD